MMCPRHSTRRPRVITRTLSSGIEVRIETGRCDRCRLSYAIAAPPSARTLAGRLRRAVRRG